ncbi:Acyltransferase family protein [Methyloligella halotolerans]|uniref:Acyltransferase family protein n=1 Tax=Methyloligella halotolerans TaxID=1177755 RepID=A0A1E2S0K3_9HYPH|nr:acyltransferase [Methyloligella halotolerans]ODA67942.1 Acyltransferase family protein [Methyloligella halotolerans]
MKTFLSIHYLRGIAALGVLVFHACGFVAGYGSGRISPEAVRIGEAGVDIFFVISGFILTIATQKPTSGSDFMLGRFARVGVPYWSIILTLAVATIVMPSAFRSFAWEGSDLFFSLAFVPTILRDGSIFPMLEPGWTLCLEMLFYVVMAIALVILPASRSALICCALASLVIVGFLLDLPQGQSVAWFFTQPILLEFCFGILIAHFYLSGFRMPGIWAAALAGVAVVSVGIVGLHPPEAFEPARTLLYGLPATALVAGLMFLEADGRWVTSRALSFLGTISYSLYLTHVLSLAVVAKLLGGRVPGLAGDLVTLAVSLAASIVAAFIYFRLIEKPALLLSRRLRPRHSAAPPAPPLEDTEARQTV